MMCHTNSPEPNMNNRDHTERRISRTILVTIVVVTLTLATNVSSSSSSSSRNRQETPEGYTGLLVMLMDGKFNLSQTSPHIPGCIPDTYLCDGDYFWKIVAHNNPLIFAQQSHHYMQSQWGIHVDQQIATGGLKVANVYVDPRANYRAHLLPRLRIHRYGWHVHHHVLYHTLLRKTTLTGARGKGEMVPAGTSFAFGQYWIQKSSLIQGRLNHRRRMFKVFYESDRPIRPIGPRLESVVVNRVTKSPWGSGMGVVTSLGLVDNSDGLRRMTTVLRNVITLDNGRGAGRFAGVYN